MWLQNDRFCFSLCIAMYVGSIVVYCFQNTISPHHLFLNSHRRSSNMPSGFRIGVRKSWEESSVKYIICKSTLTKETYLTVITLDKTLQPTNNVLLKYFFHHCNRTSYLQHLILIQVYSNSKKNGNLCPTFAW